MILVVAMIIVIQGVVSAFTWRFSIGIDPQKRRCLPRTHVVLIDHGHHALNDLERGDLVVFGAVGLAPWIGDGTTMVKLVAGLPGDRVTVAADGVFVNGQKAADGLAGAMNRPAEGFIRRFSVPPRSLFVLGRSKDSFDSRYWGTVKAQNIQGIAYRLF